MGIKQARYFLQLLVICRANRGYILIIVGHVDLKIKDDNINPPEID